VVLQTGYYLARKGSKKNTLSHPILNGILITREAALPIVDVH